MCGCTCTCTCTCTFRAHSNNISQLQDMKLTSLLLFRLHDERMSRATIKSICNVINAILGSFPNHEDLRRSVLFIQKKNPAHVCMTLFASFFLPSHVYTCN